MKHRPLIFRDVNTDPDYDCWRYIPNFVHDIAREAQKPNHTREFIELGFALAQHTRELIGNSNTLGDQIEARCEELLRLLDAENRRGVLLWYEREFPRCLSLVPFSTTHFFVDGVFLLAADNWGIPE